MSRFNVSTTGADIVKAYPEKVAERIFVITGGSAGGIGAQVAISLAAAHPAQVIILGRSREKVAPVLERIRERSLSTEARFIPIDLASYDSIYKAAEEINSTVPKIDVLINNAGVMGIKWTPSPAGIEGHLAANHIGHFLLTKLLAPKLEAAHQGARIVNVSSQMYQLSPVLFDDYNFSNGATYNTWLAYGQSKTANILFSVGLARKAADTSIKTYSVHPGNIQATNLYAEIDPAEFPIIGALLAEKKVAMPKEKTVEEGSATTLAAALDPGLENFSGAFLDDCSPATTLEYASSSENAERLWALSEKLIANAPTAKNVTSWW